MSAKTLYFTGPRAVRVEDEAVPEPAADEVLVRTRVSAVSAGTELLVYRGEAPETLEVDEEIEALSGDLRYPLQYGYAAVGDVVDQGATIEESWHGRTVFAFSPHRTHFTTRPDQLYPVPNDVPCATATLLPVAETATNLVLDGRPMVGERVVVFGAGMVGLFTTRLLASFPLERLTVVDPVDRRRELARMMGADEAVPPGQSAAIGECGDPSGADLVYELSGTPETLDDAIDAVGYDGRIVAGSWYGRKRAAIDLGGFFHRSNVTLMSSQVSRIRPANRGRWTKDRRIGVAWEHLRSVHTERLVTHRIPFDDAASAYELLDDGPADALQVLLMYGCE